MGGLGCRLATVRDMVRVIGGVDGEGEGEGEGDRVRDCTDHVFWIFGIKRYASGAVALKVLFYESHVDGDFQMWYG